MEFSPQFITEQLNLFSNLTKITEKGYSEALLASFAYDVNKAVDFYFQDDVTQSNENCHVDNTIQVDLHVICLSGNGFKKVTFHMDKKDTLTDVKHRLFTIERDSFLSFYGFTGDFDEFQNFIHFANVEPRDEKKTLDSLTTGDRLFFSVSYLESNNKSSSSPTVISGPKCRFIINKANESATIDLTLNSAIEDVRNKVKDLLKVPLNKQDYQADIFDDNNPMMDLILQTLNTLKNEQQANSSLESLGIMSDDIYVLKVSESRRTSASVATQRTHTIHDILRDAGVVDNLVPMNHLNDSTVSLNADDVDLDNNSHGHGVVDEDEDDDDSYHCYSDEDEDNFIMKSNGANENFGNLLIPDSGNLNNLSELTSIFVTNFAIRYCKEEGDLLSIFWPVDIDEAIAGTITHKDATLRKPLFIYIHNDKSIAANIFVSQLMCSQELLKFFEQNSFVIWPFDVSTGRLKDVLLNKTLKTKAPIVYQHIKDLKTDQYPLLLMLSKIDGSIEVLSCVQSDGKITKKLSSPLQLDGNDPFQFPLPAETITSSSSGSDNNANCNSGGTFEPDRILASLLDAFLEYQDRMEPVISEYRKRMEREALRKVQEQEFLESLERDKIKMMAKREEEEDARRRQHLLDLQRERADTEAKLRREKNLSELPIEPACNGPDVITIKIRLPSGCDLSAIEGAKNGCLIRRFYKADRAHHLIAFIESLGFSIEKYKLTTSYPVKDLTQIDDTRQSFAQLNFGPQEALILEER